MDRYYIGLTLSDRQFQDFSSNWSVEKTMLESGYDLVAGPFKTRAEAQEKLAEFQFYQLRPRCIKVYCGLL